MNLQLCYCINSEETDMLELYNINITMINTGHG